MIGADLKKNKDVYLAGLLNQEHKAAYIKNADNKSKHKPRQNKWIFGTLFEQVTY